MTKKVFNAIFSVLVLGALVLTANASTLDGTLTTGAQSGVGMEGVVKLAPTPSPVAATYNATQSVTLSASGSTGVCYTTDGTTPACATSRTCTTGTLYSSAISVAETTTIKSKACYADASEGPLATSVYTLQCSVTSVSNGSVAAYSSCAVSCNSGYTLSGSSCVANSTSSGGGGGGGGSSISGTYGCMDKKATNYSSIANVDNGACIYPGTATTQTTPISTPVTPATQEARQTLITQLLAQIKVLQAQLAMMGGASAGQAASSATPSAKAVENASPQASFKRDITTGVKGDDVKDLQVWLNTHGYVVAVSGPGSLGNETTTFGALTRAALIKFQKANGITPAVGYFGPKTRAAMNAQ